ncbi:MAG: prepilin peptidase [Candidatus Woesearchaeota archaeon]|nr:MAG: prepilin peptidase [Candidatus Woesearchaeota archaeon]
MIIVEQEAILLIALIIGTITDIRKREVPNYVSFSLIAVAGMLALLKSGMQGSFTPLITALYGLAIAVGIGLLMYYAGQWGGGDAKILFGVGLLLGFSPSLTDHLFLFLVYALISGGILGFVWMIAVGFSSWKETKKKYAELRSLQKNMVLLARIAGITCIIIAAFLVKINYLFSLLAIFIGIGTYILVYLSLFVRAVEDQMKKKISVLKLEEGDWLVNDVTVTGKLITAKSKTGLSLEDIAHLKRAGVSEVVVRQGVPFVPAFLAAEILVLTLGNPFM